MQNTLQIHLMPLLVLNVIRLLAEQFHGTVLDIEVDNPAKAKNPRSRRRQPTPLLKEITSTLRWVSTDTTGQKLSMLVSMKMMANSLVLLETRLGNLGWFYFLSQLFLTTNYFLDFTLTENTMSLLLDMKMMIS